MKPSVAADVVSLTCMSIGATRFAFPTLRVARVEELEGARANAPGDVVDLSRELDLADHAAVGLDVLLHMTGIAPAFLASLPLSVVEVRSDALHPVPEYLAPWARSSGVAGVVVAKQALTFLLDVDLVFDRHLEARSRTGTSA